MLILEWFDFWINNSSKKYIDTNKIYFEKWVSLLDILLHVYTIMISVTLFHHLTISSSFESRFNSSLVSARSIKINGHISSCYRVFIICMSLIYNNNAREISVTVVCLRLDLIKVGFPCELRVHAYVNYHGDERAV